MKNTDIVIINMYSFTALLIFTGPPNRPILFCSLASVVCHRRLSASVTLLAGGPAGRWAHGWSDDQHRTAGQYGYVALF